MRLLLLAERISPRPWSPTRAILPLARALAREATVDLAVDLAPEVRPEGALTLHVRRPGHAIDDRRPRAFRAWAREVARRVPHDASATFSPIASADAWIDLDERGERESLVALRRSGFASAWLEAIDRAWLPGAILARRRPAAPRLDLPEFSTLDAGERAPADADRLRRLARLPERGLVFLASCAHADEPAFSAMVRGFARARSRATLVVVGRWAFGAWDLARAADALDRVRVLGPTRHAPDLLRLADLALAPSSRSSGFARDAIRLGVPAVAPAPAAPGALASAPNEARAGAIVEALDPGSWARAIDALAAPGALDRARAAARARSSSLDVSHAARCLLDSLARDPR